MRPECKTELDRIHDKLDKLLVHSTDHSRHFKNINGAIQRHEASIAENSKSIWTAKGGVLVLGIIVTILSLLKIVGGM